MDDKKLIEKLEIERNSWKDLAMGFMKEISELNQKIGKYEAYLEQMEFSLNKAREIKKSESNQFYKNKFPEG